MSSDVRHPALSRREREVAALVAAGMTDRQIAGRLSLSVRTVEGHVLQIRNKLALDNRTQIATWMTRASLGEGPGVAADSLQPPPAPNNLPAQLTRFVGRAQDLGQSRRLLQQTRLLTLTGPGGSGKTRLAIQIAGDVPHRYPAGLWFVDLSPVRDPHLVPRTVAAAVGISEPQGADPLLAVAAELASSRRRRPALVILDNCEHLVEACGRTVDALLRASPDLTFLCTSREPLHVAGEAVWRLSPLSLPQPGTVMSVERVEQSEAAQLFLDRVSLSDPTFELGEANAADVAQLCAALDGLPLAMELAAARVGLMSLGQVLDHLQGRIRGLGQHGAPSRQQTLSATIEWSYDLLSEAEARLLRHLSVFSGGFTLEAAEAVCEPAGQPNDLTTLDLLTLLVDKSLVLPVPPRRARYRCLELIRRYAWDRLLDASELEVARRRHFEFFFDLVQHAAPELTGPAQSTWLERLTDDHDNLRAALEFSRGESGDRRLQLVLGLTRFWHACGHIPEGRDWTRETLAAPDSAAPTPLRAQVLSAASGLAFMTAASRNDLDGARAYLRESLAIWESRDDRSGVQVCLGMLGVVALIQGDWETSRGLHERSLALARELGDVRATGVSLCNLGLVAVCRDDHEKARAHLLESLEIMRRLGDTAREAVVLTNLGLAHLSGHDLARATDSYQEALRIMRSLGTRQDLAECLEGLAAVAALGGEPERALRLAGAASGVRETIGAPRAFWTQRLLDGWIAQARAAQAGRSSRAWEEGEALSMEDALRLALENG